MAGETMVESSRGENERMQADTDDERTKDLAALGQNEERPPPTTHFSRPTHPGHQHGPMAQERH